MSDSHTPEPESAFVCDCKEQMRSACAGETFYKAHEGKLYCVLHFPGKEKSADFEKALQRKLENKDFNFRGVWFADPLSFFNFAFDRDVDFGSATFAGKVDFILGTFKAQANFSKATFSGTADFLKVTFAEKVDFAEATFNGRTPFSDAIFGSYADFGAVTFSKDVRFARAKFTADASFIAATFTEEADFHCVVFGADASFRSATFGKQTDFSNAFFRGYTDFGYAIFGGDVDFTSCGLRGKTDFANVTFRSYARFAGNERTSVFQGTSSLDLRFARIEGPHHLSFQTLRLRPHWFVNIDARKFEFINVKWQLNISQEIKDLNSEGYRVSSEAHQLLATAFRHLAVNAEENHRYEEASKFRYMAMDARRRESWLGFASWKLSWWYWLASGYGERAAKAFLVLLGIFFLSAVIYTHVGFARWETKLARESDLPNAASDEVGSPLPLTRALAYSAAVMTFQKPEPRPATTAAQTVVLLETILGPVQAALLALAIRRKFMR